MIDAAKKTSQLVLKNSKNATINANKKAAGIILG